MKLVVGIDDGGFIPLLKFSKHKPRIPLVAVYYKNYRIIDVIFRSIKIDGLDGTNKLLSIINRKRPDLILSQGVTFGGFNIIDFVEVNKLTGIPVIVILDRLPNFERIFTAINKHFKDANKRITIIKKLPKIIKFKDIYYENIGIEPLKAEKIIGNLTIFGKIPEPIRLAHLICRSIFNLNKILELEYQSFKIKI
jgi:Uncharacterized conserved protein